MPKLLTKRKAKWVSQRPSVNMLRGTPLNPSAPATLRYEASLHRLVREMTADVEKQLTRLFRSQAAQEYFSTDASIASQSRVLLNALTKKYDDLFVTRAKPIAEQVATMADKSSSAALHGSLKQLSGGLTLSTKSLQGPIMEVWKATVNENVLLIKSIPQKYLNDVAQATQRAITSGRGLADLVPYLQKKGGITERRASFIAHDQTRKAFSSLNRARMDKLGLTEAEWLHTSGSHEPRHTHIEMSGKTFKLSEGMWDSAVDRFIYPAEEPGCRCRAIPVISLDKIGVSNG